MPLLDGLISYIPCNEATGTTRVDAFGPQACAEISGTVEQVSALITGGGGAADFDGAGEYLSDTSPSQMDFSGSFTIGMWAKKDATTGVDQGGVCRFEPTGNQRQFALFYQFVDANYVFGLSLDGAAFTEVDDGLTPADGTIHMVLGWYNADDNTLNIKTDNNASISAAGPVAVFNPASTSLDIGRLNAGAERIFNGAIGPVMIWNKVLSAAECVELYNGGSGALLSTYTSSAKLSRHLRHQLVKG